jgi:hypothetical protein
MKNILFEKKRIKVLNKWHSVENPREIMQRVFKKSGTLPCCLHK